MAQRVVLAIGLASDPELVIADEPTRGIDDKTAAGFIDQMNALFSGAAVVLITHNISVAETCEKIMVMYRGRVMEYGETARVLNDPQSEYTRCLIAALPKNGLIAAQNRDFLSKEAAIC